MPPSSGIHWNDQGDCTFLWYVKNNFFFVFCICILVMNGDVAFCILEVLTPIIVPTVGLIVLSNK